MARSEGQLIVDPAGENTENCHHWTPMRLFAQRSLHSLGSFPKPN